VFFSEFLILFRYLRRCGN